MIKSITTIRFHSHLSSSFPLLLTHFPPISHSFPTFSLSKLKPIFPLTSSSTTITRRNNPSATMFHHDPFVSDILATAVSGVVAFSALRLWQETAKRRLFDQKLNRKLVHITIGLLFIFCWPLFSTDKWGSYFAAFIPAVNVLRLLVIGLGIWKDDAEVKSMSRFGDHRELLKGPLYYAATLTFASIIYWRTSPISIAAICNMCAGDGMADIVGRRFGSKKISYNKNKSYAGSIAMASSGFLASIGFMWYFSSFGYMEGSWKHVIGFLVVSIVATVVESLPISTDLDDNLTVPLTSILVGSLVL
ncbi:probable phytol kinase 3, chloroplastic [Cicer arietinum]|uniref:Probable phytol kinase 3, chloroplastic n=1 Tax=Cicer arietinum TaxID=3827 RepID=A0A1S2Y8E3_CICAR|nr:probable phytol kinase 3, chloroplastic [Cicer arietinum]